MSSPQMMTMFGRCCCCCAVAGTLTAVTAANDPNRPSQIFLAMFMNYFHSVGCHRSEGSAGRRKQSTPRIPAPPTNFTDCLRYHHENDGDGACLLQSLQWRASLL